MINQSPIDTKEMIKMTTELSYDPDRELTTEEFKEYFPNMGDLEIHRFSEEGTAFRYAQVWKLCVFNENMECVYCFRHDH